MTHWLLLDDPVPAPTPNDPQETFQYKVSPGFVRRNFENRKRTAIFQLWAHVLGRLPPINNIGRLASAEPSPTLTTLRDAIACFRGLKRPHDAEPDGASVLVYVLNPVISIEYFPDMVCLARAVRVPKNTVLTVQVRPDWPLQPSLEDINGSITRLEFVSSRDNDPTLPKGFDDRYEQLLWRR